MAREEWTPEERRILRSLRTPDRIQHYLESTIRYNKEPNGLTCFSPRRVMRDGVAHCMEGAMFAAAALRFHGHRPLLLDLEAVRDDDHVLALYRADGGWGAVAKSNYAGLRYRDPVYRTLRELVMSYFDCYYNLKGERSLRAYSRPVDLSRFDRRGWMTSEEPVWYIPQHLCDIPHTPLLKPVQERSLTRLDARSFAAGKTGSVAR